MPQIPTIYKATLQQIPRIKALSDLHRQELGFLPRAKIEEVVISGSMLLIMIEAEPIAFVIYRHRKRDTQTTLSSICVAKAWRQRGLGRLLITELCKECKGLSRTHIQLKCPVDLQANDFYQRVGFYLYTVEPGRVRPLNVWRMSISTEVS